MSAIDRRQFVQRSLALVGAGGAGAVMGALAEAKLDNKPSNTSAAQRQRAALASELRATVPFDGTHQAGILTPAQAQATLIALDSIATNRQLLAEGLQAISQRARGLTQGETVGVQEMILHRTQAFSVLSTHRIG